MFQRMVVVVAFALAVLLADNLLAQCHHGGSQGGGFGGGCHRGGFGGGGFQSPMAMQGGLYNPMAMQAAAQMQRMWLQQQYVKSMVDAQQRQQRLATRAERVAKEKEREAQQRAENRARIAALTGRTVGNPAPALASDP